MTLHLDKRRRAMLREMGVWLPPDEAAAPAVEVPATTPAPAVPGQVRSQTAQPVQEPQPATRPSPQPSPQPSRAVPPVRPAAPVPVAAAPAASTGPAVTLGARPQGIEAMDWPALADAVAGCQACGLCRTRRNTVFGVGPQRADWMVIGEAPGENEDLQGEPFVGQAGKLLDAMLRAVGRSRAADAPQGVYIANVLKCRPPGNRNPDPAEMAQCEPFLKRQIALVQPRIILAMGRFAVQALLQTSDPIGRLRGRVHRYEGTPVVVTYHPAYLLRNLPDKAKAWADLCLATEVAAGRSAD